jgi:hypothetical protein
VDRRIGPTNLEIRRSSVSVPSATDVNRGEQHRRRLPVSGFGTFRTCRSLLSWATDLTFGVNWEFTPPCRDSAYLSGDRFVKRIPVVCRRDARLELGEADGSVLASVVWVGA